MIIVLGKTCSGKDTIVNQLISKHGYQKCITYTTRPMRDNEEDGIAYHFISTEKFKRRIEEGFFIEYKIYNTESGSWYYGTALQDFKKADNKTIVILTPQGYRDITNKLKVKPKSIYIYANNSTIKSRLLKRGDEISEAKRRVENDNKDFFGVENEVDKIIYNNDYCSIDEVVEKFLCFVEG